MTVETNLMRGLAGIVESVALYTITILAFGVIVSAVKLSDVVVHLGTIIFVVILLLMLPAIIVNIWSTMHYWQHLGIVFLGIVIGLSLRTLRQTRNKQ